MNKNIKKVIAVALTLSAVSAVVPATNYNLLSTKAYAASENYKLSDISMEDSSGNDVTLYEKSNYKNKLDNDSTLKSTYYAKVSSGKSKVKFDVNKNDGIVKIFKDSSSKAYDDDDDITISKGKNTIYINVYEDDTDEDDMKKNKNYKKQYKIVVQRGSSSSDDDNDNKNNDVYLDRIKLSEGSISFSKSTTSYNVKVDKDVDSIKITAEPKDDEYIVRINGSKVKEDDDWKKEVDLEKGKNKIEITVEDDDNNKRTYTLNITRGQVAETSEKIYLDTLKVGGTNLTLNENKKDYNLKFKSDTKKIQIYADPKDSDYTVTIDGTKVTNSDGYKKTVNLEDGKVQSFKVKVKNSSGTEQVYTLNIGRGDELKASDFPTISSGTSNNNSNNNSSNNNNSNNNNNGQSSNITVGNNTNANKWVIVNGKWQFNDSKGTPLKNQWYYYNKDGKDYYLDQNGNMATGWIQLGGEWYYLGSDGAKKTGWQYDGSAWYYMDGRGVMLKNTVVGGYRLQANGAWDWR